jgi:hypothetical protein
MTAYSKPGSTYTLQDARQNFEAPGLAVEVKVFLQRDECLISL